MDTIEINKPCFMEIEGMLEDKQLEFTELNIVDPARFLTAYPFTNKVKYYKCVEDVIKEIADKYCDIQIEDIFTSNYNIPFMEDLCFFIKGLLSSLNNWEIKWYVDNEVKNVVIEKLKDGNIDSITTEKNADYQMVFKALMFELKQECFRMEGYNFDEQSLKKIKINKEESKND